MKNNWTPQKENRLLELLEKNFFGPEPRLTPSEEIELQKLSDEYHEFVGV